MFVNPVVNLNSLDAMWMVGQPVATNDNFVCERMLLCRNCGVGCVQTATAKKHCSEKCRLEYNCKRAKARYASLPSSVECKICEAIIPKGGKGGRYRSVCSNDCKKKIVEVYKQRSKEKRKVELCCPQCGVSFIRHSNRRIYCSGECAKKHYNKERGKRRRATGWYKTHGVQYRVLVRDGWECKACGIDTPHGLRGSNDNNAPEVDHIYPWSRGGSSKEENLQCLCRKCNLIKSDRTMDEWLSVA